MIGKQFAVLITITFIVGMVWLISDIIFNTKASIPVSPQLETALQPINPSFNSRVLETVNKEVNGNGLDIVSIASTPAPSSTSIPVSTQSGQLTPAFTP